MVDLRRDNGVAELEGGGHARLPPPAPLSLARPLSKGILEGSGCVACPPRVTLSRPPRRPPQKATRRCKYAVPACLSSEGQGGVTRPRLLSEAGLRRPTSESDSGRERNAGSSLRGGANWRCTPHWVVWRIEPMRLRSRAASGGVAPAR